MRRSEHCHCRFTFRSREAGLLGLGDRVSLAAVSSKPQTQVETFKNPKPERDYEINFECPEFTCLCPLTGQPDFAHIAISYIPDALCIELKSLKLYLWSFRDRGAFHEAVTNEILDHLIAQVAPRQMEITASFNVRGGISTDVVASYDGEP